jgi:hypothetical protein
MTTLHLNPDDIAALVVSEDGSVTVELTDKGVRTLEAAATKRAARRALNVQITEAPGGISQDGGFAAGYARGYAEGRGPGMPPLRA